MQNENKQENPFVQTPRVISPIHRNKLVDFCKILHIILFSCLLSFIFLFLILLCITGEISNPNMFTCTFNLISSFLITLFLLLHLLN